VALSGHRGWVNLALFSPDGNLVLTSSEKGDARVWRRDDQGTWSEVELRGHLGRLTSASFSPDSAKIVIGTVEGAVQVWDHRTDHSWFTLAPLKQPDGWPITAALFAPDGGRIAIVSANGIVSLLTHDASNRWHSNILFHPQGDLVSVDSGSWSRDGTSLLTVAANDTVRVGVIQRHTWAPATLTQNVGAYPSAAFSPDGTRIVTCGDALRVWSSGDDGAWSNVTLQGSCGGSPSFSPDGTHLISSGTFSPDGNLLLTWSPVGANLWNVRWLMGPEDWRKTEPLSLPETICREKLHGSWTTAEDPKTGRTVDRITERLLTADDIKAAPILSGHEGEDVCAPFLMRP
jgi:WD40 repeat protein